MYKLKTSLVIVESPAKCKKIESFLGGGYKVMATYGHFRYINSLEDIDINNNFQTKFSLIQDQIKLKQIERLREEISKAYEVILACDGDREGEGICWHICDLFGLQTNKTKRIIFHEITEQAILNAIRNPGLLDMNLVHAQQSRQILDMLVGFTISPMLWNTISRKYDSSLSAGRCQSPALRLVYDNHIEVHKSPGKQVYNTTGIFTTLNLEFELNKQYETQQQLYEFYNLIPTNKFSYSLSNPKKVLKKAPEPLSTSTLQQLVSNEFRWSPKETMKHAQQLYENGYITYMRTDSKKYSKEFIDRTKAYIEEKYGKEYISASIDNLALVIASESKEQNKEAHESIRPVSIAVTSNLLVDVDLKAVKLYELIWLNSIQSCMPSAQLTTVTAKINAPNSTLFTRKAEQVIFLGWLITDKTFKNDAKEYQYFHTLKKDVSLLPKKIQSCFTLIELKSHYTEARLVQILEEKGIGRPSTFASLVDKIQERKYVLKKNVEGREITGINYVYEDGQLKQENATKVFGNETNKLIIQPVGLIVIEYLIKHFDSFFNYEYTGSMEEELDLIARGLKEGNTLCIGCYTDLHNITKDLPKSRFSIKIDENHSIIIGKYGPVIKCITNGKDVSFLPIKKGLELSELENKPEIKLEDVLEPQENPNGSIGKYKGKELFIKKGKFGLYAQWDKETRSLKEEFGDTPIDKISYSEVIKVLDKNLLDSEKPLGLVRELTKELSIRTGKYGDYIYYKKFNARKPEDKKPKFFALKDFKDDYKKCDKDLLVNWILQTHFTQKITK